MHAELEAAIRRAAVARAELSHAQPTEAHLRHIEDVLCEGYAQALAGDGWLMSVEQRVQAVLDDPRATGRARELRLLATERARVSRSVSALRDELAALRGGFDRQQARFLPRSR